MNLREEQAAMRARQLRSTRKVQTKKPPATNTARVSEHSASVEGTSRQPFGLNAGAGAIDAD